MDNKELKVELTKAINTTGMASLLLIVQQPTDDPEITSLRKEFLHKIQRQTEERLSTHPEERERGTISLNRGEEIRRGEEEIHKILNEAFGVENESWRDRQFFKFGFLYAHGKLKPAIQRINEKPKSENDKKAEIIRGGIKKGLSCSKIAEALPTNPNTGKLYTDKSIKLLADKLHIEIPQTRKKERRK